MSKPIDLKAFFGSAKRGGANIAQSIIIRTFLRRAMERANADAQTALMDILAFDPNEGLKKAAIETILEVCDKHAPDVATRVRYLMRNT